MNTNSQISRMRFKIMLCKTHWSLIWKVSFPNKIPCRCGIHNAHQALPKTKSRRKMTLYEVLDVPPTATQSDVKNAYYELSLKYHPDRNSTKEGKEKFSEITMAYGILGSIDTRRQYDREIGTYHLMRSSLKKGHGTKVLQLTDDTPEINMYKIDESTVYLKTITSLCTILGQPVRLANIRTHKGPYGVLTSDMRMLRLLRQICNGTLAANVGQTSVTFLPGELQSGRFTAEAGRLGSLSTLIEGAVPCLPFIPLPQYSRHNTLDLKGTTHSLKGMHIDYFNTVYKQIVGMFGFNVDYEIRKRCYSPHWEGKVLVKTAPIQCLNSVNLTKCGRLIKISGWAFVSGAKPIRVAQILAEKIKTRLKQMCPGIPVTIGSVRDPDSRSEGTGQGVLIQGNTATGCVVGGTALWRRGMSGDNVVNRAAQSFEENLSSEACIDYLMQDQMILLMALADGTSAIRVGCVNKRTHAAIDAVQAITEVKFSISRDSNLSSLNKRQSFVIECQGLGVSNSFLHEQDANDHEQDADDHFDLGLNTEAYD